jgi:hypothetical protein
MSRVIMAALLSVGLVASCAARVPVAPAEGASTGRGPSQVRWLNDWSILVQRGSTGLVLSAPVTACPLAHRFPFDASEAAAEAERMSIPFQYYADRCAERVPGVFARPPAYANQAQITDGYTAIVKCTMGTFHAKPFWIPRLFDTANVCEIALGKPWRMIGAADAEFLAPGSPEFTRVIPGAHVIYELGPYRSYARTSNGELSLVGIGINSPPKVPIGFPQPSTFNQDDNIALRCVRSYDPAEPPPKPISSQALQCAELMQESKAPDKVALHALVNSATQPPSAVALRFQQYVAQVVARPGPLDAPSAYAEIALIQPEVRRLIPQIPWAYETRRSILVQMKQSAMSTRMADDKRRELERQMAEIQVMGVDPPPASADAGRDWKMIAEAMGKLESHARKLDAQAREFVTPCKSHSGKARQSPVPCSKLQDYLLALDNIPKALRSILPDQIAQLRLMLPPGAMPTEVPRH